MPKVAFLSSELRGRPLPKGIVIKIEKTFQSFLGSYAWPAEKARGQSCWFCRNGMTSLGFFVGDGIVNPVTF